ncbi:hypothetical protein DIPPA_21892 [Diplonema papillatum]|nr:hypothetical protein DIPPA_21892 [Diplonema papillatum]
MNVKAKKRLETQPLPRGAGGEKNQHTTNGGIHRATIERRHGKACPTAAAAGAQSSVSVGALEKEISVQQLLTFLLRDVEKTKHYRRLPFYIAFLAVMTTLVALTGLGGLSYNERADHNTAVTYLFRRDELLDVRSANHMWQWLHRAVTTVWIDASVHETAAEICGTLPTEAACLEPCMWLAFNATCVRDTLGSQNIGLGFLLLRQWRVRASPCAVKAAVHALPQDLRDRIVTGAFAEPCSPTYSASAASTSAYGASLEFESDASVDGKRHLGVDLKTSIRSYGTGSQFSQVFSFDQPLSAAVANLTKLELTGWVTRETRAVALSSVYYNPSSQTFVSNDAFVEVFHTGKFRSGYVGRPFSVLSFDTVSLRALFAFDVMHVVLCLPMLLWSFAHTIQDNFTWMKAPGSTPIGLWEIYEALHITCHVFTAYYRITLWVASLQMTKSEFYEDDPFPDGKMFNHLTDFSEGWMTGWAWAGASIVLSYLRIFKYLQYNQRLCVLSETIRTAAGDLAGMSVIFTVVLAAYAFGGTMLYGWEVEQFMSFGSSCAYLLQVLFSGEVIDGLWQELLKMHPVWTPLYMLTYFLLSWVVLLNMVIAALSNSFILVVQQQAYYRRSSASGNHTSFVDVLLKGVRKGWARLHSTQDHHRSKDPREFLMLRTSKLKNRYRLISEALKGLAREKEAADNHSHYSAADIQSRYSQIFVTWNEVTRSLEDVMPSGEMERLFERVHKLIACDEQASTLMHLSQRYFAQLAAKMTELINTCRPADAGAYFILYFGG